VWERERDREEKIGGSRQLRKEEKKPVLDVFTTMLMPLEVFVFI
jgi:hypothetical protein